MLDRRAADQQSDTVERALVRAARALTTNLDVQAVTAALLDAVADVFGATSSWVLLYDGSEHVLRTVSFRGPGSDAFGNVALSPEVGILGLAFTTREVVFVADVKAEQRWYDPARVHASGLRSVFTVPLLYKDEVFGVVGLDSPRFTVEQPPTGRDIERLEALAAQAAVAFANARLYDASERDRRRLRALVQERQRLRNHVTHLREEVMVAGAFGEILGDSGAFAAVMDQARLVAPGDTTVLVLGETGTGKELVARFIHDRSLRAKGPFVAVNCAALPEALVESELFGHEKGAFTGALVRKPGKFEIANQGTLFLDEIGDLPPDAQAKMLRVLQDGLVQRVGSTSSVRVNVRVIAATNHDLEQLIAANRFRSDLYYRLSVFPIVIPPLRARSTDVELLARHFVRRAAAKLRRAVNDIAPDALERLRAYDWPGNVRELQNVMERAVVLSAGPAVQLEAIALPALQRSSAQRADGPGTLAETDRRAIVAALEAAGWRISGRGGAAEMLGLKPTTLHARMKKLRILRPGRTGTRVGQQTHSGGAEPRN